ncbi:MAG: acetyl-CoA carboxylase biotin carboxylase subunit [Candidatus Edwardsbacteria bacterium]
MFKKILIANRGEIALRVMRACRELNILSVAVFSEADRSAPHTRYADEAYFIGPSPSTESYLRIDKILDVAKKSKAEAIHPGYGFLAENENFAKAVEGAGIMFIGPTSKAMALLGDKTAARQTMSKAGIPIIPGMEKPLRNEEEAKKIAEKIGFPILIKAAGGGGGKGMRMVENKSGLQSALKGAIAEASSAFGNPAVYIEKYLLHPRHVEIQVLADNFGKVVHLNERECSIQRRYQKMIEESPCCIMTEDLRRKMGESAKKVAKTAGYTNAGTVEFLVDKNKNFYFLEVNTRLQVEHPVTELVTGIDIVKEQIHIASGEKLRLKQEEVWLRGAAIECRISAEDPDNNFFPSTGRIEEIVDPTGPGIRVESGIFEGYEIPLFYDPLIAKVLAWGRDRQEAIVRMQRALSEYKIKGIKTTIPFHKRILSHRDFLGGNFDTGFLQKILDTPLPKEQNEEIAAMAAAIIALKEEESPIIKESKETMSNWKKVSRWMMLRR